MGQRLIGRLIYLSHTKSDITTCIKPKKIYLQAAYLVFHYLNGTPEKGIVFKRNNRLLIEAYIDANYAGSLVDRGFATSYYLFHGEVRNMMW